jgi:TonB family protein
MRVAQRWCHDVRVPIIGALILFTLGMGANMSSAQQKQPLPSIASASVPLYPRTPQMAHIEGVVRLRISTDGSRASSIEVESGQPMLAQAAKENVKTWQFEQHSPTTFEATFRYRLLPSKCDSECNCDSLEKGTVLLRLPAEVEVSAKELLICDPAAENKR